MDSIIFEGGVNLEFQLSRLRRNDNEHSCLPKALNQLNPISFLLRFLSF